MQMCDCVGKCGDSVHLLGDCYAINHITSPFVCLRTVPCAMYRLSRLGKPEGLYVSQDKLLLAE